MVTLTTEERSMLEGAAGEGLALAMRIIVGLAEALAAPSLLPVTRAHIDGCLYGGPSGLEFADRLVEGGARVAVPATLNVSSLDLLHPDLYRGEPTTAAAARRLMDAYVEMGCTPTWTCAPYQLPTRPSFGEQIAWAESNAIVFANSVLGARTNRYGDFVDIAAAVTGRVPDAGLHRSEHRVARRVFDVSAVAHTDPDVLFPLLGFAVGSSTGWDVPAVVGIPTADEDQLKAFGAAAATAGSVGLFHMVGITPEAPDLETALGGRPPRGRVVVTRQHLDAARRNLNTAPPEAPLAAVSVGTPHYSLAQVGRLVDLFAGRRSSIPFYASTGRAVLAEADAAGLVPALEEAGVQVVVDTCTYVTPIIDEVSGVVLTDSAKWAYYAPGNIGVEVAFASTADCVESAIRGVLTYA